MQTVYYVLVTDAYGCTATSSTMISVVPPNTATATSASVCIGDTAQLFASGGGTYLWTPGNGLSDSTISNPIVVTNTTTNYTVSVSASSICPPATAVATVKINPIPTLDAGPDLKMYEGSSIRLQAIGSGVTYLWTPDSTLDCSTCADPIASPAKTSTYKVITISQYGCRNEDSVTVHVEGLFTLYIPNAFTPGKDHKNEIFYAYGSGIKDFEMLIFNRWGELIFESHDITQGWDGTYKGQTVQQDVYIFTAKVHSEKGDEINRTGTVTVVK
jgi:gliding motility-associated-like protein